MSEQTLYHELLRPRFHFTAQQNWLNDPNGLVYFQGEYHMFFQYNACGINWGPNSWGHAISTDLVHWQQLPIALDPDEHFGWIWSGSAVVDWNNTSGLGNGSVPPLVAIYTAGSPPTGKPVVQCIAFSNDRGRTWTKYAGNPVIANIEGENRDPKVIWHAPIKRWIMSLYLARNDFALFASRDLKAWTHLANVPIPGGSECPDFFELPIDGDPSRTAWVLWCGDGIYRLGTFDGLAFVPETLPLVAEHGPNGYAAQTWSDVPDGRRVQISWMRSGQYPYMPFNQQMSFPVTLTLRTFPEGVRLCREPVQEIARLWGKVQEWRDYALDAGGKLIPQGGNGLYDLSLVVEPGAAEIVRCRIHGQELKYRPKPAMLSFGGKEISLPLTEARLALRVLVDRTSVEIFAREGSISASFCFLPVAWDVPLEFSADGDTVRVVSLTVREMTDAWNRGVD